MASRGLRNGISKVTNESTEVTFEDLQRMAECGPLEVLVTGVAAVSEAGARLGKGHGYFDLDWGLLSDLNLVSTTTDVIAIAHDCQVVSGTWHAEVHDTPVDLIVTPTRVIRTGAKKNLGKILWGSLEPSLLATPLFQQL